MSVITFPDSLPVARCTWAQQRNDVTFRSGFGAQSVELSAPLWAVTLEATPGKARDGGGWQAFGMQTRGQTNQIALWNHARPVPLGTMRGTMTLSSAAAQGATSLSITSTHNLIQKSTEFDQSPWTGSNYTITPNTDVAPDGTMAADTVTDASTSSGELIQNISGFVVTNTYTASVHIKKDATPKTTRFVQLGLTFYGSTVERPRVGLDTSTGEIAARQGPLSASVSDAGDYWRLAVTAKSSDPLNTGGRIEIRAATAAGSNMITAADDGNVTGSCVVWGAQVDLGGLTSYGKTLLQGDYLGIGSGLTQQVVMVVEDADSSDGRSITVQVEPALRNAFSIGEAVTWNRPKALFRRVNSRFGWENHAAVVEGFTLDLIESWVP